MIYPVLDQTSTGYINNKKEGGGDLCSYHEHSAKYKTGKILYLKICEFNFKKLKFYTGTQKKKENYIFIFFSYYFGARPPGYSDVCNFLLFYILISKKL